MYLLSFLFYTGPPLRFLTVEVSQWLFLVGIYMSEKGFIFISLLRAISLGIFSFQNHKHMFPRSSYLHSFVNKHCCYFYPLLFYTSCNSFLSTRLGDFKRLKNINNPICFEQFHYDVSCYNFLFFHAISHGIYWICWNCGFIIHIRFGKES